MRELVASQFEESADEPLPLKIGVNTGVALVSLPRATDRRGQAKAVTATGMTITLASRLAENAEGTILISHDTFREVFGVFDMEPAEPLRIRGRKERVETYRVLAAKARAFRMALRGVEGVETQLIGRRAELESLQKRVSTPWKIMKRK